MVGRTPLSTTEKPEKSPAALGRARSKLAVFRGKRGLFWLGRVLFGGEALGVKNRAKTEKTGGWPPVWSTSGPKRGLFLRGNSVSVRSRVSPSPAVSRVVDDLSDAIGRAGGGIHSPGEVVRVIAGKMNPADRFHRVRPELLERAQSEGAATRSCRPTGHATNDGRTPVRPFGTCPDRALQTWPAPLRPIRRVGRRRAGLPARSALRRRFARREGVCRRLFPG